MLVMLHSSGSGKSLLTAPALHVQANKDGVRGVMMRLPPFVYTKDFSFFYDVMYKAAEKKDSASYVGDGAALLLCYLSAAHCLHMHDNMAIANDTYVCRCIQAFNACHQLFLPQLTFILALRPRSADLLCLPKVPCCG